MIAKAFGIYITELFNQIPPSDLWVNTLAAVLIIGLALLNMMQASDVGRSETVIVIIKVAILFALVFAALFQPGARLHPPAFSRESMDFCAVSASPFSHMPVTVSLPTPLPTSKTATNH